MANQLLTGVELHYPSAREWMWDYCVYLGSYTDSEGENFDLGIFIDDRLKNISSAIVYGSEPGEYFSGELGTKNEKREIYLETYKRAKLLGLMKYEKEIKLKYFRTGVVFDGSKPIFKTYNTDNEEIFSPVSRAVLKKGFENGKLYYECKINKNGQEYWSKCEALELGSKFK